MIFTFNLNSREKISFEEEEIISCFKNNGVNIAAAYDFDKYVRAIHFRLGDEGHDAIIYSDGDYYGKHFRDIIDWTKKPFSFLLASKISWDDFNSKV